MRVAFNVIDEAIWFIDRPHEPWTVQAEARAAGRLDDERLRLAVRSALARHPMARARQAPWRFWQPGFAWEITEEPQVDALSIGDCPDDAALARIRSDLYGHPVPLATSPPLRVRLAHHAAGDVVLLGVNHAASDGLGTLRLLASIVRGYAGAPDPVPDVDPLAVRDLRAPLAWSDGQRRPAGRAPPGDRGVERRARRAVRTDRRHDAGQPAPSRAPERGGRQLLVVRDGGDRPGGPRTARNDGRGRDGPEPPREGGRAAGRARRRPGHPAAAAALAEGGHVGAAAVRARARSRHGRPSESRAPGRGALVRGRCRGRCRGMVLTARAHAGRAGARSGHHRPLAPPLVPLPASPVRPRCRSAVRHPLRRCARSARRLTRYRPSTSRVTR